MKLNKKTTIKILVLLIVLCLVVPQITLAAWWNPFTWSWNPLSWFRKSPSSVQISISPEKPTPTNNNANQPQVSSLKATNPDQYKKLVNENKTQLAEANKVLSNKNIIAKVKPAVVYIQTNSGSGSGMISESNGYIVTNAHVVTGYNAATIKLSDGRSFSGSVIGRDEKIDVALLKINASNLSTVQFGNSDLVEQGDDVFTLGYPFGLEGDVAFKNGTISRRLIYGGATYLETSAEIHPGNSGGPLVNNAGQVVGINTAAIGSSNIDGAIVGETIKLAIPINIATQLISSLKAGRNVIIPKATPTFLPKTPLPTPRPTSTPASPKISNIRITTIYTDAAVIRWNPIPSLLLDVNLEYGTNADLSGSKTVNTGSDGVLIGSDGFSASTPLKPGTTYYFRINSKNSAGEEFHSDIQSFKTLLPPTPIPNIFTFEATRITVNSVRIRWSRTSGVGSSSDSVIEYSTNSNFDNSLKSELGYSGYLNYVDLVNLQENTTYYYRLNLKDIYGKNVPDSNIGSFTTASLSTPTPTTPPLQTATPSPTPTPSETATPSPSETPTPTPLP